jgi:serine/threonine-protein kinase
VTTLVEDAGFPRYASSGHLLFGRQGTVYAAPFDPDRLALTGQPVPVLEGVVMWNHPALFATDSGTAYYDLARDGTLLFSPLEARLPKRTLIWLDRHGGMKPVSPSQRAFSGPGISPDGRRLAVTVTWETGSRDVFVLDLERDAWTRVTSGGRTSFQAWLPDGERLLVLSSEANRLALVLSRLDGTGSPEALLEGEATVVAAAPDGRSLLFCRATPSTMHDIWRLPLEGERVAQPWLATPSDEANPSFSPDGRFVAYPSDDSGRHEVYVRLPRPGPRHQVSAQGGGLPRWSPDGREIFFLSRGALWAAAVRTSVRFTAEAPRKLFELPEGYLPGYILYDATPDGQKFVMVQEDPFELRPIELALVPNWLEELEARMAAPR